MELHYKVNPQLPIPIYRQLVDAISASIRKGDLVNGQQLPTVQEMSVMLDVARGTAKRIYDELERVGLVEKIQGRGTFVRYRSGDSGSRKERAMAAIDALLDDLEAMGLSNSEINIFLNLKLRQRAEQEADVKVALLECNPENLSHISEQMRSIPQIELYSYLLESITQYPYKIGEDVDMVVTTHPHVEEVEKLLPMRKRVVQIALRLTRECLSGIVRLRRGQTVGILCYSPRFGSLLYNTCQKYNDDVQIELPVAFTPDMDIEAFMKDKDVLLVPETYEKYCTTAVAEALRKFRGQIITCAYELDEGSLLYLREKSKRILASKTI